MRKMIVCTSSSCMNYLERPSNIAILPINVHINNKDYLDGVNIDINEISEQIINTPKLPVSTSAPDTGQLLEFFYELVNKGINEVMIITISSFLSQTYQNIQSIQAIFGDKLKIHLFDSCSISHGEALLALEASKMLYEGKEFSDIARQLTRIRQNMSMFITVDNLKTMIRTKRISAPLGFFADLFDIKPIVYTEQDGRLDAYQKVRGFEESVYRVVELVSEQAQGRQGTFYTACNTINPHLPMFKQAIKEFGIHNVFHAPLASVCVANVGVYALGMMFVENYFPSYPQTVIDPKQQTGVNARFFK